MRETFKLNPSHIALFRRMCVSWCSDEYGAPEIDPKRPYGNSDVENDIREILGEPNLSDEECREVHEEMEDALQIVLSTGNFVYGEYERIWPDNKWVLSSVD